MINIGLTGWGDHDSLYEDLERQSDKLQTYALVTFQSLNLMHLTTPSNLKEIS